MAAAAPPEMTGGDAAEASGLGSHKHLEGILFTVVERAIHPLVQQLALLQDEVHSLRLIVEQNGAPGSPSQFSESPEFRHPFSPPVQHRDAPLTSLSHVGPAGTLQQQRESLTAALLEGRNNEDSEATLKPYDDRTQRDDQEWLIDRGLHTDHLTASQSSNADQGSAQSARRPAWSSSAWCPPKLEGSPPLPHRRSLQSKDCDRLRVQHQAAMAPCKVISSGSAGTPSQPTQVIRVSPPSIHAESAPPQWTSRVVQEAPSVTWLPSSPIIGPSRSSGGSELRSILPNHSPASSPAPPSMMQSQATSVPVPPARGPMTPVVLGRHMTASIGGSANFPMPSPLSTSPLRGLRSARAVAPGVAAFAGPLNVSIGPMVSDRSFVSSTSPRRLSDAHLTTHRPLSPDRLRVTSSAARTQELPVAALLWQPSDMGSADEGSAAGSSREVSKEQVIPGSARIGTPPAEFHIPDGMPVMERCNSARRSRAGS